jgi:hypothetical protein
MNLKQLSDMLEDHLTDQDIQDAQELLDNTYQEIVDMRGELVEAQAEITRLNARVAELEKEREWLVNIPAEIDCDRWYMVGSREKALILASLIRQDATEGRSITYTSIDSAIYAHEQAAWMARDMATEKEQSDFNEWLRTEMAEKLNDEGVDL